MLKFAANRLPRPQLRHLEVANSKAGWYIQVAAVSALSALCGALMQFTKLGALDASARTFAVSSNSNKQAFLATFGVFKAISCLSVAFLVQILGYKWTGVLGWGLGILIPTLISLAPPTHGGWSLITAANCFVGIQQGLCWTVSLLMAIKLFNPQHRGLAAGLNETFGYIMLASAAPMYSMMEPQHVQCSWHGQPIYSETEPTDLTASCMDASHGKCSMPDDWVHECVGQCTCSGYTSMISTTAWVLVLAGLAVNLLLLRDSNGSGASRLWAPGTQGDTACEAKPSLASTSVGMYYMPITGSSGEDRPTSYPTRSHVAAQHRPQTSYHHSQQHTEPRALRHLAPGHVVGGHVVGGHGDEDDMNVQLLDRPLADPGPRGNAQGKIYGSLVGWLGTAWARSNCSVAARLHAYICLDVFGASQQWKCKKHTVCYKLKCQHSCIALPVPDASVGGYSFSCNVILTDCKRAARPVDRDSNRGHATVSWLLHVVTASQVVTIHEKQQYGRPVLHVASTARGDGAWV